MWVEDCGVCDSFIAVGDVDVLDVTLRGFGKWSHA
jgi:hypothetical protein